MTSTDERLTKIEERIDRIEKVLYSVCEKAETFLTSAKVAKMLRVFGIIP